MRFSSSYVSLLGLIEIGYELCGTYALDKDSFHAIDRRTTVGSIKRFIDSSGSIPGIRTATRAARYIIDDSASPMETRLALLLCLPPRLGGYGIPFPCLNHPIMIDGHERRCDLCWPKANFALEYDSDSYHSGIEQLQRDSMRRMQIESADIHVISVTKNQVNDVYAFDRLARIVAKRLGKRIRTPLFDDLPKKRALRSSLLKPKSKRAISGSHFRVS